MSFKSNKGILLSSQYLKITAITPACVSFKFKMGKQNGTKFRDIVAEQHHFVRINLVIQLEN
jgi:hypothetical protein